MTEYDTKDVRAPYGTNKRPPHNVVNTKAQLDEHFACGVAALKVLRCGTGQVGEDAANRFKQRFTERIEQTIQELTRKEITESGGVGEAQLREILDTAKNSDWTEASTIVTLYETYTRIVGVELDESILASIK